MDLQPWKYQRRKSVRAYIVAHTDAETNRSKNLVGFVISIIGGRYEKGTPYIAGIITSRATPNEGATTSQSHSSSLEGFATGPATSRSRDAEDAMLPSIDVAMRTGIIYGTSNYCPMLRIAEKATDFRAMGLIVHFPSLASSTNHKYRSNG